MSDLPDPALGPQMAGATNTSQQDQGSFSSRVSAFMQAFNRPDVRAALLQAGARLMQPIPVGQTPLGQVGVALTEGAQAAQKTQSDADKTAMENARLELARRQVENQQRQTDIQQQSEKRLESQGQQKIDLAQRELDQTKVLEQQKMALQRELARETNDVRKGQIMAQLTENQNNINAAKDRLATEISSRLNIADKQAAAGITKAALNMAIFYKDPNELVNQIKSIQASVDGMPANVRAAMPKDLGTFTPQQWAQVFQDPSRELKLRLIYRNDPAQLQKIDAAKQEFAKAAATPAPQPQGTGQ